jgi:hypothetical protein
VTSIVFTSLFLGLVAGNQTAGVLVEGPAAAVEYRLDGKPLGRVHSSPWELRVDFGTDLAPHELVAAALDSEGREVGSAARQWLNLPREDAETEVVLERNAKGRPVGARLSWQSIVGSKPRALSATFDGKPLAVDDSGRIALPGYDPEKTHVLSARLEFPEGLRSRADVVLGGGSAEEAKTELTAIAVRLDKGRELPPPERLQDWFVAGGRPLRVVAVEEEGGAVVIVRDSGNREASNALEGYRYAVPFAFRGSRLDMRLRDGIRTRLLWPVAKRYDDPRIASDLFETSPDFSESLHWILTRVHHTLGTLPRQRFADATAVAGLVAFGSSSRRAVVLVLGTPADASGYSPESVRHYLATLGVPLHVWSLVDPATRPELARWGPVADVSSVEKLRKAFVALRADVVSQRVVWFEGKHLPQKIELTGQAAGVALLH